MTNFLLEICCNNQEVESVEEEEEEFFESLDRILSSSSSSCSSDNDEVGPAVKPSSGGQIPADGIFPMPNLSSYDVWIAEPASVNERRQSFLRQLGLSSDKSLSRVNSGLGSPPGLCREVENASARRTASCDQIIAERSENAGGGSPVAIARSSSDGATTSTAEFALDRLHCFPPHSDLNSIQQQDSSPLVYTNQYHALSSLPKNGSGSRSSPAPPSKPPSGKFSPRSLERIKSADHLNWNPSFVDDSENANDPRICTIKNLDNGDEFVVNEFGEDGMWNKLREIGTGRQLTREEFEMCVVGHSPIVQELMRRQGVEESGLTMDDGLRSGGRNGIGPKSKKKGGGWLKSLRNVASSVTGHHRERRSSDERDTSSEKGGRRSSSATDDSQDVLFHAPERTKVRHYGKSSKELTALYMSQEIQGHNGSIWSIKFSLDGRYLATAGEDRVIHIWQVTESDRKSDLLSEKLEEGNSNHFLAVKGSPELILVSSNGDSHLEQKKRGKISYSRKSMNLDHVVVPESVFALSEKPVCSFRGHIADVLDLSWSKSEHLLSSSMDKTVRLWHMSSRSCLKMFSHSDYVTCIQFNPVDDRYFISGSLDAKVRIWSIPDRQVVDWNDLHEMVTAACYTPDGQGALVGSHKGSCHLYNTSDNKLHQKSQISLQNKKKKAHVKKITGFQFTPGSSSEVLVTSADSRIRVLDGVDLVHKYKGFRNTSSQISAATNGNYVVCASEDSQVYVWRYDSDSRPTRGKGVNITRSYEYFHCQDVSVAIPWPGFRCSQEISSRGEPNLSGISEANPVDPADSNGHGVPQAAYDCVSSPMHFHTIPSSNGSYFSDRVSVTWPEEKLLLSTATTTITATDKRIPPSNGSFGSGRSAWGMVIVTAGLGGEIRAFQNFGLPIRI